MTIYPLGCGGGALRGTGPPGIKRGPRRGLADDFDNSSNGRALNASEQQAQVARRQARRENADELRFRRKIRRLHSKGSPACEEFWLQVAAERMLGTYLDELLDRFDRLEPRVLAALGADRPVRALHAVPVGDNHD